MLLCTGPQNHAGACKVEGPWPEDLDWLNGHLYAGSCGQPLREPEPKEPEPVVRRPEKLTRDGRGF